VGGIMAFGAGVVIVGPSVTRLAVEGLRLWRKQNVRPPVTSGRAPR